MPTEQWTLTDSQGNQSIVGAPFAVSAPTADLPYVGAAVAGNGDPGPLETFCGRPLGVRRTYWNLNPSGSNNVNQSLTVAAADHAAKRVPFLSYKLRDGMSWGQAATGAADADIDALGQRLAALAKPVKVAIAHEPEGDGVVADWTSMQRRLLPRLKAAAPNVQTWCIFTCWTSYLGSTQYRLPQFWPVALGPLADVLGMDCYNRYGDANHPTSGWTEMAEWYDRIVPDAIARGVDWGIAETGYSDEAAALGAFQADWLTRAYDDMANRSDLPGDSLAYFNSDLNSNASWPLGSGVKRDKFKGILVRSRAPLAA